MLSINIFLRICAFHKQYPFIRKYGLQTKKMGAKDGVKCSKFPSLHDFNTQFFIHADALKSLHFCEIFLVSKNFVKDFWNQLVSEFIVFFALLIFII